MILFSQFLYLFILIFPDIILIFPDIILIFPDTILLNIVSLYPILPSRLILLVRTQFSIDYWIIV